MAVALEQQLGKHRSRGNRNAEAAAPKKPAAEGGAAETSGGGKKVFYISPVAAQPGQQQINQGLEQAAKELGWSESVLDSALSAEKQVSNVETAINQGAAAIASWTLDPNAVAGAYEQAQSKEHPDHRHELQRHRRDRQRLVGSPAV